MVKVSIFGPITKNILGNLSLINGMDLEYWKSLMGKDMKDTGVGISKMEKGNWVILLEERENVCMKMEK